MAHSSTSIRSFPKRILVITHGGHGDILLTTPLVASLKRAYPRATIDVFVQNGRGGMLAGNPDIGSVFEATSRHGAGSYLRFFARHTARYGLAVSTRLSDRQVVFARAAGRRAISTVSRRGQNHWWKKAILNGWAYPDRDQHVVFTILQLAEVLGIEPVLSCRVPMDPSSPGRLDSLVPFAWRSEPFALLHLTPRNPYKEWTSAGWRAVVRHLQERGCQVVLVGGSSGHERRFADRLAGDGPGHVVNLTGTISFADASALLEPCRVYIGPDTAMTHLAAACEAPTIALYGRVIPAYMPYHKTLIAQPYEPVSPRCLRSGPVHMVLGTCACPAGNAICVRTPGRLSTCMGSISADSVTTVIDQVTAMDDATSPTRSRPNA